MRIVLGVLAGLAVAFACVFALEWIGHGVFPPPPGLDLGNPADVARLMAELPAGAFVFVLAAWFLGCLAGAWTAIRIVRRPLAGWIVAALVILAAIVTMAMIPHPWWMWVAGILLPLAGGWLAQRPSTIGDRP